MYVSNYLVLFWNTHLFLANLNYLDGEDKLKFRGTKKEQALLTVENTGELVWCFLCITKAENLPFMKVCFKFDSCLNKPNNTSTFSASSMM